MTEAAKPAGRSVRWKTTVSTLIVMVGALLSRVLGLGRDAAITARFGGASPALDTYNTAFQVPDLLYLVISGGALASTLIPVFQQVWNEEGEQRAWEVVSAVVNLVLIALAISGLVIIATATPISRLLFALKPVEQQQLLAQMMRLFLLSSPLLLGLGGIAMAVLNARERFGWTAAAFNLYNVAIIVGAVFLARTYDIWGVAYGVVLGAICYLGIMLPGLAAEHARYIPRLGLHDPAVRRIGRQLVPRLIGQAAAQFGLLSTAVFAARLPGDKYTSLRLANQLMLLPHGVFVISLVTVMFPQLARLWSSGQRSEFSATALQTLRLVLFVSMPLAILLGILRVPIVRLLYERRSFTAASTQLVAMPLLFYATALVAFAASEPLIRAFYAMQDTRTPVYIGIATIALNVCVSYILVNFTHWDASGLAFAFSLANNLEAVLLYRLLVPRLDRSLHRGMQRSLLGVGLSAATMAVAVWGWLQLSAYWLPMVALEGKYGSGADFFRLMTWIGITALGGLSIYLGMATIMHVPEVAQARALLQRRRRPAA